MIQNYLRVIFWGVINRYRQAQITALSNRLFSSFALKTLFSLSEVHYVTDPIQGQERPVLQALETPDGGQIGCVASVETMCSRSALIASNADASGRNVS